MWKLPELGTQKLRSRSSAKINEKTQKAKPKPLKTKKKYINQNPQKKTLFIFFQVQNSEIKVMFILDMVKKLNTIPADISYVSPSQVLAKKL